MWCAQFKSAERTFELSQPSLVGTMTNRTCGLSPTQISIAIKLMKSFYPSHLLMGVLMDQSQL